MTQTDAGIGLASKNRLDNIRGQRSQLEHSSNVAAVDTICFGNVFQVLELTGLQLVLPRVRLGYGGEKSVIRQPRLVQVCIRFDTVSQDHLAAVPHLTISLNRRHAIAAITVPNGVRGGFRSKLANIGFDGFLDIVKEIELKLRPVIKKSAGAKPMLYATQRHYRSQRSDAEIDGRIDVDLRTAIRGNGTLVKYQPQWIEAIYELLVHKKANIQLGFDVQFLYSCKAIRSAEAVELFADSWIAMSPILGLAVDG